MELLEKLKAWLQTYPGWAGTMAVDHTYAVPGQFGLYPRGVEVQSVKKDVLGNVYTRCRSRFDLYRVTTGQADNTQAAGWLLDFQAWVRDQTAKGLTPAFGDVPEDERLTAQQGKLLRTGPAGMGMYAVTLTAAYTKICSPDAPTSPSTPAPH